MRAAGRGLQIYAWVCISAVLKPILRAPWAQISQGYPSGALARPPPTHPRPHKHVKRRSRREHACQQERGINGRRPGGGAPQHSQGHPRLQVCAARLARSLLHLTQKPRWSWSRPDVCDRCTRQVSRHVPQRRRCRSLPCSTKGGTFGLAEDVEIDADGVKRTGTILSTFFLVITAVM